MPLESCMILLDNSEYMRNGDYIPTRLEAQQDAANLLVGAKTQSHPESTVGISAGTELLVSPTDKVGTLLNAIHQLTMHSSVSDVTASVQVASLALKHRRNKNGSQRIVLFVGSPLDGVDKKALAKAGRLLKKNNVAIDVVAIGELSDNEEKLKELVDAANGRSDEDGERTCHLVTIPEGVLPSDVLASSPIVHGGSGGSAFAASAAAAAAGAAGDFGGAGAFAEYGGVDPNMDPELAMALRFSMEEERARQERAAAAAAAEASAPDQAASSEETKDTEMTDANQESSAAAATNAVSAANFMGLSEEEALLQQALAMSMNENEPTPPAATSSDSETKPPASMETEEDDEAAAMQLALQMSMQPEATTSTTEAAAATSNSEGEQQQPQFQDPEFVSGLLGSLPGVNQNDPAIQNALKGLNENKDSEKSDENKDGEGDKKE